MVPAPLKQIADTGSSSSLDEDRAQQKHVIATSVNAGKHPDDWCPQSEGHRDRRRPYPGSGNADKENPKTMQLWRDVVRMSPLSCLSNEALQLIIVHAHCLSFSTRVRPAQSQQHGCQALANMLHLSRKSLTWRYGAQRTGQYFRLIPDTAANHEQSNLMQPSHWQKTKTQHVWQAQPGNVAALEDVDGKTDGPPWSADPVRSTCCIQ